MIREGMVGLHLDRRHMTISRFTHRGGDRPVASGSGELGGDRQDGEPLDPRPCCDEIPLVSLGDDLVGGALRGRAMEGISEIVEFSKQLGLTVLATIGGYVPRVDENEPVE